MMVSDVAQPDWNTYNQYPKADMEKTGAGFTLRRTGPAPWYSISPDNGENLMLNDSSINKQKGRIFFISVLNPSARNARFSIAWLLGGQQISNSTDLGAKYPHMTLGSLPSLGTGYYHFKVDKDTSTPVVMMFSADWATNQDLIVGLEKQPQCSDIVGRSKDGPDFWYAPGSTSNQSV